VNWTWFFGGGAVALVGYLIYFAGFAAGYRECTKYAISKLK
jgi:hypothetical protein